MAAIETARMMAELDSLLCGSSFSSSTPTDMSSSISASLSSTPPTTVDSMSLASEPDLAKPESITASTIEAVMPAPETPPEPEQHESGQQTPVGEDAIVVAEPPLTPVTEPAGRPRRARSSLPVYNIAKLAGTDVHGRRRSKGDAVLDKRRRTISDGTLVDDRGDGGAGDSIDALAKATQTTQTEIDASDANRSTTTLNTPRSARISKKPSSTSTPAHLTRRATRLSGASTENLKTKLSALTKRGKRAIEKGLSRVPRELMRLQDTNEFAHIDTRPVRYTVWSNGKYIEVDPTKGSSTPEPPRKKVKVDEKAAKGEEKIETDKQEPSAPVAKKPCGKKWLDKGLYAGQEAPIDIFKGLTAQEKKKLASIPELMPSGKPNHALPQPMYTGLRILINGRDFKLPFDVCNPLPPGQPKPTAYRTMTKNRFVGNATSYWKKTPHFEDFASRCVCKPEDGCGEDCQNRIMLYECDETNCNLGKPQCTNRAFQDLQERTKKGGRYRVGVEVLKTGDRGYGVRSNRCFEPNQIIMEYTGEIITVEECERRMNEVYKDNECYYLMSFDQNMIIDATTGSIARFVNHSCSPNCRMIKWIVSGQPRMALFAGDRPISTGDELTYDYNFDPFSAKNVQKCLCGSANCRGVLGPKPKEVKPPKPAKEEKKTTKTASKSSAKASTKASAKGSAKASVKTSTKTSVKRKLKDAFDFDGDDEDDAKTVKKRKIRAATGLKRSLSSASLKKAKGVAKTAAKGAAKGAVTTIKRSVSSISVAAKKKTGLISSKVAKAKAATTKTKTTTKKTTKKTMTTIRKRGSGSGAVTQQTQKKSYGKKTTTATTAITTTNPKIAAVPSRSPSLTIVAAGVSASSSTTLVAATTAVMTPASSPKKTTTTTTMPPKLTLSSGKTSARKLTPSRKAIESGLVLVGAVGQDPPA
ncbi:hypothetical protein C8A00DRAFT_15076 [Chaetomidium leptoderma]|uniref:Uncharacterized protein n=1 Tax=Chaetomidium leptoderma TaxID=669021 RepID=A0AAN6VLD7_9PEZI|nr:hypothetical protein C8A00DRAFT_15076 [Chaetomidium leptoderma]